MHVLPLGVGGGLMEQDPGMCLRHKHTGAAGKCKPQRSVVREIFFLTRIALGGREAEGRAPNFWWDHDLKV